MATGQPEEQIVLAAHIAQTALAAHFVRTFSEPRYRCDRGHEPTTRFTVHDGLGNSVTVCSRCVLEVLARECGQVTEVAPADSDPSP